MTPKQFGAAVVAARRRAGLTQVQLAERLQTTQQYVSAVECGAKNVSIETWSKIEAAIGQRILPE